MKNLDSGLNLRRMTGFHTAMIAAAISLRVRAFRKREVPTRA